MSLYMTSVHITPNNNTGAICLINKPIQTFYMKLQRHEVDTKRLCDIPLSRRFYYILIHTHSVTTYANKNKPKIFKNKVQITMTSIEYLVAVFIC